MLFLRTRNFFYDALALAVTEIGVVLLAAGIVAGAIAGHNIGGLWWMWNPHLTAALVAVLLYAPYLMLRPRGRGADAPRRLGCGGFDSRVFDVPLIALSVNWWLSKRTPAALIEIDWTVVPIALLGALAAWMRLRKEQDQRARDAQRRTAQEI